MIDITADIPFLWRLSPESSEGYCSVSMVVPCPPETEVSDFTIETTVVSLSSDSSRSEQEEILEWNQEDISLFIKLVNHQQLTNNLPISDTLRIDLTDPAIIDIVHVVAAAGFGVTFSSIGLIKQSSGYYPPHRCEVGTFASLNLVGGFAPCVVVDVDEDDVVCVILEDVDVPSALEFEQLNKHDLLLVKRMDILHPEFAAVSAKPKAAVLH